MFPDALMLPTLLKAGIRQRASHESVTCGKNSVSEEEIFLESATNFVESNQEYELSSSIENRFFADSPYYDAFVEKEMHSAEFLCTALRDIGTQTESFSKASEILLKSLDSLSSLCRQCSNASVQQDTHRTRVELGPEIVMLQSLGKTLEEISAQHKKMFDVISTSLGYHLQELSFEQARIINELKEEKKEVEIQTRLSEREICKYLNRKSAACRSNSFADQSQNIICSVSNYANRTLHYDPSQRRSHEVCCWSQKIQMEETTAELKRFQLIKNIVDANYERRIAFNQTNEELLESMQNCFEICSEKVAGLLLHVGESQRQCLHYQNNKKPLWEEREKLLVQTLTATKKKSEISSLTHSHVEDELTKFDSDIWDLPYKLATVSRFQRPSPRDVVMEGWLHQKCSSIISLQPSWVRRWFILKSGGIYYLESDGEGPKLEKNKPSTKFKVKLFDIALCTVRELPDEPSSRFSFELINSSSKSITLQARGPKELQMWLDRIRSAVKAQLAKDIPQIEEGTYEQRRRSSEIKFTVVERRSSFCWDRDNFSTVYDEDEFSSTTSSESDRDGNGDGDEDEDDDATIQLLKANPVCADCSAVAPDWASLNLGTLVCLECSGVHRSLGCHVSKVRSLMLDRLSHGEATLLLSLGNERANRIWEKEIKPESKSLKEMVGAQNRKAREDWIRRKYVVKEFIGNDGEMKAGLEEKLSRDLYAACEKGDVVGMATALAHGANVNWKNADVEDGACTALRISVKQAISGKQSALACTELLLQNGAKVDEGG